MNCMELWPKCWVLTYIILHHQPATFNTISPLKKVKQKSPTLLKFKTLGLNCQTHELMDLNHPNEFKLHTLKNLQTNIRNFLLNPLVFTLLLAKYKKDLVFEEFGYNTFF